MHSTPHLVRSIRRDLRDRLPAAAFEPCPVRLLHIAGQLALLVLSYRLMAQLESTWALLLVALMAGHAHLCVGLSGHDLSHGTIVRGKRLRYALELLVWGTNATCPTAWVKNHNQTHHRETNTQADSFRYFSQAERTLVRRVYGLLFLPNHYLPYNPLVAFTFVLQLTGHTVCGLFGRFGTHGFITNVAEHSRAERLRMLFELAVVVGIQSLIFRLCGGSWDKYMFAALGSVVFGGAMSAAYLYTQHTLYPLSSWNDPLQSTSVIVPSLVDWLHGYVGHHTAHHLFEGISPEYLPRVTQLMRQHYPEWLDLQPLITVLRRAQENKPFKALRADPNRILQTGAVCETHPSTFSA